MSAVDCREHIANIDLRILSAVNLKLPKLRKSFCCEIKFLISKTLQNFIDIWRYGQLNGGDLKCPHFESSN